MPGTRDRGEVSAQVAVIAPLLFSLVFAVVHAGSLWIAAQTAQVAARRGARAASTAPDGTAYYEDAAHAVEMTVRELGGQLAAPPRIAMGAASVTVDVSLGFARVVPFLPDRVARSVTVPLERYVPESER